jgi:hypothetical protein
MLDHQPLHLGHLIPQSHILGLHLIHLVPEGFIFNPHSFIPYKCLLIWSMLILDDIVVDLCVRQPNYRGLIWTQRWSWWVLHRLPHRLIKLQGPIHLVHQVCIYLGAQHGLLFHMTHQKLGWPIRRATVLLREEQCPIPERARWWRPLKIYLKHLISMEHVLWSKSCNSTQGYLRHLVSISSLRLCSSCPISDSVLCEIAAQKLIGCRR